MEEVWTCLIWGPPDGQASANSPWGEATTAMRSSPVLLNLVWLQLGELGRCIGINGYNCGNDLYELFFCLNPYNNGYITNLLFELDVLGFLTMRR